LVQKRLHERFPVFCHSPASVGVHQRLELEELFVEVTDTRFGIARLS
jgi:hypothetical protein